MDPGERQQQSFATTQWSIVLKAGRANRHDASTALATLCQSYWFPLYAYVRRRVKHASEAQDLTQEFFTRLIEKEVLASASPEAGRFRSSLR
jgi:DNA-directed RNA polymerase specialized sigma24 family protein